MVVQLAMNLLGDRDEALDLSQEVFLRVFRTIARFRGQSSAAHLDLPHRRQPGAQPAPVLAPAPPRGPGVARCARRRRTASSGRAPKPGPIACSRRRNWPRGCSRRSTRLPFDQRTAIVLREIDGLSYEEIAFSLGVAVGTVKSRLTRARQTLRARAAGGEDAMKVLSCAAARRRLQAYHDDELPVGEQIEVDAHLEWCDELRGGARRPAAAAVDALRAVDAGPASR